MTTTELPTVDAVAAPDDAHGAPAPEFAQVVLQLRERIVTFDAVKVSTIPDFTNPLRPDDELYLTRRFNVVWHDPRHRTITVFTMDEFVRHVADAPFSWVIDEVLAAVPMPVEQLDI